MDTVQCAECGYLSRRSKEGFLEADTVFRKNPSESFDFQPGETQTADKGKISCYRQAANLSVEISAVREAKRISAVDPAQEVINRSRQCSKFIRYEPGVDPPGHLVEQKAAALEEDRRRFEQTLTDFQVKLSAREARQKWRLGIYALLVVVMMGCVQIWASAIAMSPESIGINFGRRVLTYTQTVASWFGRTL
ncbi:MAG: hypothetical protein ACLPX1_00910 [Steroidobacteraceae bacterium]